MALNGVWRITRNSTLERYKQGLVIQVINGKASNVYTCMLCECIKRFMFGFSLGVLFGFLLAYGLEDYQ